MVLYFLLFSLLPIAAYLWSRRFAPQHRSAIVGAALGLVISPISFGLYATYQLGPLGIPTGMAGLLLVLWHATPGYYVCIALGLVAERAIVEGPSQLLVEIVNGILWGSVYGALGYASDRSRIKRKAL
jgi:hypothetical protein